MADCVHTTPAVPTFPSPTVPTGEVPGPTSHGMLDGYDWDRAQRIRDELDTAKPGDVFAYQQPNGNRVLLVVARFEPTGMAGTTGVTA